MRGYNSKVQRLRLWTHGFVVFYLGSAVDFIGIDVCRALKGMRWDPPRQSTRVRRARWWVVGRPPVRDRYGAGSEAQ